MKYRQILHRAGHNYKGQEHLATADNNEISYMLGPQQRDADSSISNIYLKSNLKRKSKSFFWK